MNTIRAAVGILVFFVVLVIFSSLFTVTQGQQGILLRLGRLVLDNNSEQVRVLNPGLHIKTPFIENVRIFDTRMQTMDIKSTRIVTKEKRRDGGLLRKMAYCGFVPVF